METFKKELITYFKKHQRKNYLKLQQEAAFSEGLQKQISNGIMQVVYDLTKLLNNYNPKLYGTSTE